MRSSSRSLRVFAVLWVFLPLMAVMFGFLTVGAVVIERILTDLLVDRHRQIASSAAVGISEVVEGYAHILEALAANPDILDVSADRREAVLRNASGALEVFNAGVSVLDRDGVEMSFSDGGSGGFEMPVPSDQVVLHVKETREPVFSELVQGSAGGQNYILIGVPVLGDGGDYRGALVGAVEAGSATFSQPIRRLRVGSDGFAYLTDGKGRVIFHPDSAQIGVDYSKEPFYRHVMANRNTGVLWKSPEGARLFEADAAVAATGWALVVQESWGSAIAPVQPYARAAAIAGFAAVLFVVLIAWQGVQRISTPIRFLGEQTERLSQGEPLGEFRETRIRELDDLEVAFDEMARQIIAYRAGLHRYIEALTQSQENERRRIARDLHDEMVQNLLAVSRQLELYQLSESDPSNQERLITLQAVMTETLKGIRRIIGDLRPLMLEDLGLEPALKALVRALREGPNGVPHVQLEVSGEPAGLSVEQELAIYRIVQEALNNVRKHADATGVRVQVAFQPERVIIKIEDNGKGFQVPASLTRFSQEGSFGLIGIQERIWALGGKFTIQSDNHHNHGTRLLVETPVKNDDGMENLIEKPKTS